LGARFSPMRVADVSKKIPSLVGWAGGCSGFPFRQFGENAKVYAGPSCVIVPS
jgi:hypothetical protein